MRTGTNWTVGQKLLASFAVVGAITAVLGGIGYYAVERGARTINELGLVRMPSVDSLLIIENSAENIRGSIRTLGMSGLSSELRQRQYDNLAAARERYEAAFKIYEPLPQSPEESQLWTQFKPAWAAWRAENDKFLELCRQFDGLGMADPIGVSAHLEKFMKDHYTVVQRVLHLLHMEAADFQGGDDHTSCNAGRWFTTFKSDNPKLAALIRDFEGPHRRFHEAVGKIKSLVAEGRRDEAERIYQTEMIANMEAVFKDFDGMLAIANEAVTVFKAAETQLFGPVTQSQRTAIDLLRQVVQINRDLAAAEVESSSDQAAMFEAVSAIAAIIGVIAAMTFGVLITRSITRPLNRIVQSLTEGSLMVAEASNQVNASATSLAEGASEQASSLEETSSALEQMASMTRNNAENSKEANHLVQTTQDAAKRSEAAKGQLDSAMTGINESSAQISKIIKVIEEIAFQTNLLALNAAVEAARAGEHGKGFAVVAEEVRNLAQRAAEAARETTGLIETSVARAREGTEVANGFGQAIGVIVENVSKISNLISGITQASDEQARGVDQINVAVGEMDKVTQQIAANSEESASAVEELSAQASNVATQAKDLAKVVGTKIQHVDRHRAAETVHQNIERRRISKQDSHQSAASYNKSTKPLTGKPGSVSNTTTHAPEHSGSLSEF